MKDKTYTINGITLQEGMDLWRLGALRTYNTTLGSQSPDSVLYELAKGLTEYHPDVVDKKTIEEVHEELRDNPHAYTDTEKVLFNAMTVADVSVSGDYVEIVLKDWKEEKRFAFDSLSTESEQLKYCNIEPLSVLEEHLGKTIFPVG